MKLITLSLFITLSIGSTVLGQQKATVTGIITDASLNNETLPAVSVMVLGTKQGANADVNGKYSLQLNPGTHVLSFSYIGYQTIQDTITLKAGETLVLNKALTSGAKLLDNVVITAEASKEAESALLRQQQKAAVITQSIGAQEMTRKGVSNAALAVTKVTGIAKQEGTSGLFVRGLGDRYNNTLFNGLPLPSNEATNKNISLDLFGTDVIQSIGISKIYTADSYGDVGGATINILSKEHMGKPTLSVEIGSGLNTNSFRSDFKEADHIKRFGFYNVSTPTTRREYTFQSRWTPNATDNPINYNFNITGGKNFNVGEEGRIGLFFTAGHTNDYAYRSGRERVYGNRQDIVNADYFNVEKYGFKTNTTGMLNLAYRINQKHLIKWNSLFVNGSHSSVDEYSFILANQDNNNFARQTLTEQNQLFLNQLLGEHQLNDRFDLLWGGSYGLVNADMPDRITNTLTEANNGGYIFNSQAPNTNNRFFQYIDEKEWAGRAAINYKLLKNSADEYTGKLTLGYTGRSKRRDFEATQFNFRINGAGIEADPNNIDAFLNPSNLSDNFVVGTFTIQTARNINLTPFTYNVDLNIHGGYMNFEHSPNERFTYTVGLRADKVLQKIKWDTNIPLPNEDFDAAKIDKLFVLPEATLKYALSENENIRVAASKSYTLPQFLEKAPFRYEGVTQMTGGNPYVNPADNYNLDLKWEKFPSTDEMFSATIFGKYIVDPISKVTRNSALANDLTFVNAGDQAYVLGVEFEFRKNLLRNFSGGANLTYMYSRQELDTEKVNEETLGAVSVNFNDTHDALQGASPLLVNVDITYKVDEGYFRPTLALVANYFYDRIFSLGNFGSGNIVEKGYPTVNFVSSVDISPRWHIGFNVGNVLNNSIRMEQQNDDVHVETYSYKRGLDVSLGVKYRIF